MTKKIKKRSPIKSSSSSSSHSRKNSVNLPRVEQPSAQKRRVWPPTSPWWVVLLIVILVGGVRVRLLDMPLERDEGEYAYMGQLMLQGVAPYGEAYNMKMPGIYAAYALIMAVFGQTRAGIHLGFLLINAATIALMFAWGRRLFDTATGLIAAAAFATLSLSPSVHGIIANSEHLVVLACVGGLWLLSIAIEKDRLRALFACGVVFGVGFLMKQHGAVFIAFAGAWICLDHLFRLKRDPTRLLRKVAVFSVGAAIPFALTCAALAGAGVFDKFWFWTFSYAREYVAAIPISVGLEKLQGRVSSILPVASAIWALAAIGIVALPGDRGVRPRAVFVATLAVFSFLAVSLGFYYRRHYFILLLPVASLLTALGAVFTAKLIPAHRVALRRTAPAILIGAAVAHSLWTQRVMLFQDDPYTLSKRIYGGNPFAESIGVAKYIKDNTNEDDRIAVLGSEPQICFYAQRRSATGYIYTYALMENHPFASQMQREMIAEIEAAEPAYLVYVETPLSWLVRPDSDQTIFRWLNRYCNLHYERVGDVNLFAVDENRYRISVYRRKPRARATAS